MLTALCLCHPPGYTCAQNPGASSTAAPAHNSKPDHPRESLTAQAGDPTAPLVQAQVTYLYSDVVRDSSDNARQFLIEPVIPVSPTRLIPITQIIRPTVPFAQVPGGKSGLGDVNIEHVFIPEPTASGTVGFGYTVTLPTADHRELGAGKYQAGPAATLIYYGILRRIIVGGQTGRQRAGPGARCQTGVRVVIAGVAALETIALRSPGGLHDTGGPGNIKWSERRLSAQIDKVINH